jgi:hypothetical protein
MPEGNEALAALLRGIIDYAGLFPPAAHNMAETVERYARYRLGPDAVALGRLVVPAARLMEWEQAVAALPPALRGREPWRLAALVSPPASRDLKAIASFNDRESTGHEFRARVDLAEIKVTSPDEVRRVSAEAPPDVEMFYECAPGTDLASMLASIRAARGGAKIRTGGLVPSAVAPPAVLAGFVAACVDGSIPFKATAGLHHPIRATHPLTYEPDSPRAVVNGFLNVFGAAILAHACRLDAGGLMPILEETATDAFVFDDGRMAWRHLAASAEEIGAARRLARSFGSCSFDEPMADLKAMGLLP